LEAAPDPDKLYDLIVGWMVVEHLHQPLFSLKKLARWGKPGCWLAISLPNATKLHMRLFKNKWFALQAPTHLYHFTESSITYMLDRAGWRTERIFHHRSLVNFSQSMSFILEALQVPHWLSQLPLRVMRQPLFYPFSCLLAAVGQTGLITVWARKKDDTI
jgi:2-polyprenyl-3-methyl-5-hydroxy-6-metoxy-1,4-benzoquinol methylase